MVFETRAGLITEITTYLDEPCTGHLRPAGQDGVRAERS
jgi:hypothetical protein